MIVAVLLVCAVLSIPVFGGSFTELTRVPVRGTWLIVFGFGIQFVVISIAPEMSHAAAVSIHLASYACAVVFCAMNWNIRWMPVVGLGGGLNLVAIAANGGEMPASAWATRVAGIVEQPGKFANSTVVEHPRLLFLGDVFAIPKSWPLSNVFSAGDLLLVIGCVLVLHAASGARWTRPPTRPAFAVRDESASWL